MVKWQFQIFDKVPEYLQAIPIDIVYAPIGLHNFIKSYLENEEDIYYTPTDILDDISSYSSASIIQFSSAQMNKLRNKITTKI